MLRIANFKERVNQSILVVRLENICRSLMTPMGGGPRLSQLIGIEFLAMMSLPGAASVMRTK